MPERIRVGQTEVIRKTIQLVIHCVGGCDKTHFVDVFEDDFHEWKNGKLAQNAFPYLSTNDRELIISQFCGNCFDKLFR